MSDDTAAAVGHTPGPWEVRDYGRTSLEITTDCGTVRIADVERHADNARLIAAAPELLEALEWCLDWMENLRASTDAGFWEWSDDSAYATGQAAIAKARGER